MLDHGLWMRIVVPGCEDDENDQWGQQSNACVDHRQTSAGGSQATDHVAKPNPQATYPSSQMVGTHPQGGPQPTNRPSSQIPKGNADRGGTSNGRPPTRLLPRTNQPGQRQSYVEGPAERYPGFTPILGVDSHRTGHPQQI